jgi:DNA-directed RNA polymerase specialized sigma24 family protein
MFANGRNRKMIREKYGQEYECGIERTIRFLLSRGVPRDSAADCAQSAWLRGWERIAQLRDERMLGRWINTIALNTYRRAIFRDRIFETLTDTERTGTGIDEAAIDVSRMLQHCRPEDREMLEAQMAGVTSEEFAQQNGASRAAIRVRYFRARQAARQGLEKCARALASPLAGRRAA